METILKEIEVLDKTEGIWDYPYLRFTSVCFFGVISDLIEDHFPFLFDYTKNLLQEKRLENVAIFIMDPFCHVEPHVDPDIFSKICNRELILLTDAHVEITENGITTNMVKNVPYTLDTSVLHSAKNYETTAYILCLDFLKEEVDKNIYNQISVGEDIYTNAYLEFNRRNVLKTYYRSDKLEKVLGRFTAM
jgi:hypothetical protein